MKMLRQFTPAETMVLAECGQVLNITLFSWCLRAYAMDVLGYSQEECDWAVFCDIWPVIARAETARQKTMAATGVDPHDIMAKIDEAVEEHDRQAEAEELAERFRNAN